MLVSEIITRVRAAAGDTAVLQFTDADCYRWINDGMRECAVDNDLLQVTATTAVTAGDYQYNLPTDIAKLHSVKYNNQKIPVLSLQEFDAQVSTDHTDTGTPTSATIWAGEIRLYPTPETSGTLLIHYLRQPTEITTGSNEPELPKQYHRRLVDYCLAMVAEMDDDMNRYQIKMNEFRTGVDNLRERHDQDHDLYPSISTNARDMGEGFWDSYGEY